MTVEAALDTSFEGFDWRAAGLDEPEHWPAAIHTAILLCLAWPGVAFAVTGDAPVVLCNPAASRRFGVGAVTSLQDASRQLGPELVELIRHGLAGRVGRSRERVARQYLVAPLEGAGGRGQGALVLSSGSTDLEQDSAHHIRNLLARLRSIAAHSAENAQSVQDYAAHLDGRISAAGRAQTTLGFGELPADLESLVRDELTYQSVREGDDYRAEGPDVDIPAHALAAIVLAMHELATNAVKFGAFSQKSGFLDVTWRREARDETDWLIIDWNEQGVTLPTEPPREGYGMTLIRDRLPSELQGETLFEFRAGGVHATLAFPLRRDDALNL